MSNTTSENTSVQVALRIRPLTAEDMINLPSRFQKNVLSTSHFVPNQVTVLNDKKQTFTFDHVFGPEALQKDIYDTAVKNMVDKFLEGFNVTILAYGQTSSGKTHTMGTTDNSAKSPESQGIIPRAISTLFSYVNSSQYRNRKCTIKVSFVELYNEDLIDLLSEENDEENKPQLIIREDSKGNIIWSGLQEIKVTSADEVMEHLTRGSLNRQVSATDMNSQSSRSHAIFSVTLSQQKMTSSSNGHSSPISQSPTITNINSSIPNNSLKGSDKFEYVSITSKFHFVDLAGSERLKKTSSIGDRAKEGISINSGLLALGNVISALGDPSKAKTTIHVPYRDSKLTRLLQDSLGGNAQTLMIACVSPAEYNINETVNTLKYANRARNIKNVATINQEEDGWYDLEHLQNLVLKLRNEIKALKQSVGIVSSNNPGSGRNTPVLQPDGRDTPLEYSGSIGIGIGSVGGRHPSTPLNNNINNFYIKEKDIETLEEQLSELQRSYVELSKKHAKTTAELSHYQDNFENSGHYPIPMKEGEGIDNNDSNKSPDFSSLSFQEAIDPIIEEYERSITSLESKLSSVRTSLTITEKQSKEHEIKFIEVESLNHKNESLIVDLQNQIIKLHECKETNENYIKDLETKINSHGTEQIKDQETINELKDRVSQLKSAAENSESIIRKLESKLTKTEQNFSNARKTVTQLEKSLREKEKAYSNLEEKFNREKSYGEEDANLLLAEIEDRDKRIAELERKVDELMSEINRLKLSRSKTDKRDYFASPSSSPLSSSPFSSSLSTPSDVDTSLSRSSSLSTSISTSDRSNVPELESKLYELQKTHEITLLEFKEIKGKYQNCLDEIEELHTQLADTKTSLPNIVKITPPTPMFDSSFDNQNDSNSLSPYPHGMRRRSRSLSTEIEGDEKKDLNMAVIQKLQIELKQLESLHNDKTKGLEAVKQEFARLETDHLATVEIVEELREEIKRRDTLAQLEVMSVMTSEYAYTDGGFSAATSEVDQNDMIHRLRDEVEQLKEEQRKALESLSNDITKKTENDEISKIESSILQLKSEMNQLSTGSTTLSDKTNEDIRELQLKIKEYEEELFQAQESQRQVQVNEIISNLGEDHKSSAVNTASYDLESKQAPETIELHHQIERIQNEIEAKSHTIASLLFPSIEQHNIVRRLEEELQESKEVLRLAIEEKNSRVENNSDSNDFEICDKHIKELEDSVKDLEIQLTKAKETQHPPTRRGSIASDMNQTYATVEALVQKLNELQRELEKNKKHDSADDDLDHEAVIFTNIHKQLQMVRLEISQKYGLIEMLKRELADKSTMQQRLREKEADALAFRTKLMEVHKREEMLEGEMKKLKTRLHQLENGEDVNKVLHGELENLRKELKEVQDSESVALERLRALKSRLGTENEEFHLQEQLEHLRSVEIAQHERVMVLEEKLTEQGGKVDEDYVKLRTELALAKEAEFAHKKTIESLEIKLKKAEDKSQITLLKREINTMKDKEIEQLSKIQELEHKSSQQANKDGQKIKELAEEIEKLYTNEREQRKQIETLENRLELIQDEDPDISSLRDQISSLKASEADLKRNVQELESKLLSSQKEANILEAVKEDVKLLKEIETEQKSTIEQLQSQLCKIRNAKEATMKELQTMKGGFSLQKELVISQEEELKVLRNELATTKEKCKISLEEFENLSRLLNETERQRDESQKQLKSLEVEIETYKIAGSGGDDNVKALCDALSNAKLEMFSQNEILSELDSQLEVIEKERDQNAKRVEELNRVLEEKEANQKDAIKSLESTLATLESGLGKLKCSSNADEVIVANIEGNLSVVKGQIQCAKDLDEKRRKTINDLGTKLMVMIDFFTEKESNIIDQDGIVSELEKIILTAQKELSFAGTSEVEKSEKIKQLETRINELTLKLTDDNPSSAEIKSVKSEITKSKASEAKQNQRVKELQDDLEEAHDLCDKETSKLRDANKKIDELQEKCTELQNKLEDILHDSLIKSYKNIDDSMIEELTNELGKAHDQVVENRNRVAILERTTKQLELEKSEQIERNKNLEQHIEQLQKDLEILGEEFAEAASKFSDADELSKQQKNRILELETALEEAKRQSFNMQINDHNSTTFSNPALAKLASANELLNQTNENLNLKIIEAEGRIQELNGKIKLLESKILVDSENSDLIVELREKIRELQTEKEELGEANENYREENSNLDLKVESLLEQLRSIGLDGNKSAVQIIQLNEKIINLEKNLSVLKQKSSIESKEMEREITRLLEINEQLEKEIKDLGMDASNSRSSISSTNSHSNSEASSIKNKLVKQEAKISHQNNVIKALKEKISELEKNELNGDTIVRKDSNSSEFKMNIHSISGNRNIPPPPVPPPSHPPPPPPPDASNFSSSPPPRVSFSLRSDSRSDASITTTAADLVSEVQKLHKKIAKLEGESVENKNHIKSLETALKEEGENLRVAKQQLSVLQRERGEHVDEIKSLRTELDEAYIQVEKTKTTVQEEKKAMESVLEEERRAKENAEKARLILESRMEQLTAKKNKFMCF